MGKLVTVGFKLAVLGVDEADPLSPWHVVRPGSYQVPTIGEAITHARALCGRIVVSNGYAADFVPGPVERCPACWEQL